MKFGIGIYIKSWHVNLILIYVSPLHQQQGIGHFRRVLSSWMLVSPAFAWLAYVSSANWSVLIV